MKSKELLKEIKENIRNYDISHLKESIEKADANPISKQVSKYNLKNYYEILSKEISDEDNPEISDEEIEDMKTEIDLFFEGCSPESAESFKLFIKSICLYLSLITEKPLHPVGMDFGENKTVREEMIENETIYYCDVKEFFKNQQKDYYTCKFCVCKSP